MENLFSVTVHCGGSRNTGSAQCGIADVCESSTEVGICTRAANFLSFKGVPSPLPRFFRGYFHPLFISLEGITACSKLLNFHKT